MDKRWIDEYFSFTKKERTAVLTLLFLILLVGVLPALIPRKINKPDKAAMLQFEQELGRLKPILKDSFRDSGYTKSAPAYSPGYHPHTPPAALFYFDPNTLSAEGWIKLGVREKTIRTIQHYLERGGTFRKPEDIAKIYGLRDGEAERLLPYVRLSAPRESRKPYADKKVSYHPYIPARPSKPSYADLVIDINRTDTTTLQLLPGIGSRLAARIINFRDKLGGFYAVEQIAETYGLPDSTFQKIKSHLHAPSPQLTTLNLNTADAEQLKQHPYIRWNGANGIVQYRLQHGQFNNKEDLLQVAAIPPELIRKLLPYLTVE